MKPGCLGSARTSATEINPFIPLRTPATAGIGLRGICVASRRWFTYLNLLVWILTVFHSGHCLYLCSEEKSIWFRKHTLSKQSTELTSPLRSYNNKLNSFDILTITPPKLLVNTLWFSGIIFCIKWSKRAKIRWAITSHRISNYRLIQKILPFNKMHWKKEKSMLLCD